MTAETASLAEQHPRLVPDPARWLTHRENLLPAWADYTEHVSPPEVAIALETATYIACLWETIEPPGAVDFGSGFTSYVLAYCAHKHGGGHVVSVDDNERWLEWTARFLERYGYQNHRLTHTDQYEPELFDLVVYDYSAATYRDAAIGFAFEQVAPGGLIVFDDAHHERHRAIFVHEGTARGFDLYALGDWTLDQRGRYGAIGIAP